MKLQPQENPAGTILASLKTENERLRIENNTLKAEVGYWKDRHARATEREEIQKKALKDQEARIRYLTQQLYERKSEQGKPAPEAKGEPDPAQPRSRGHQRGSPASRRRDQSHLRTEHETYGLEGRGGFCETCGLPFGELPGTDDCEIIETQEVSGYRRVIHRKKYVPTCNCPGNKGIITAPGPAKLIPRSRYGNSVWIHILIRKYALQIPVARVLKNLSFHGIDIPVGSVGDNLKRLAPLFTPVYEALEKRSVEAQWWQADETRWHVFEKTEGKSTFNWYLWVFISCDSVVYVVDPSRSAEVIESHLGQVIEGVLLVDRYSAYKSFAGKHPTVRLAFCWAHVRRDFLDAGHQYPQLAEWADRWERSISALFHQNTLRLQYPTGTPAFAKEDTLLRAALEEMKAAMTGELGQPQLPHKQRSALESLRNHWDGLTVFVDRPEIPMDNNGSERTLRGPVVGRKNYYGSGAAWSATFTAALFSIFETLKLWDINPVVWLGDYFRDCALNGGQAPADISAHLPWNIKARNEKTWTFLGRTFSQADIDGIKALIDGDEARNRTAIACAACEQLAWRKPDGSLKTQSMRKVLLRMEAEGLFTLPPLVHPGGTATTPPTHTERTSQGQPETRPAGELPDLRISIADTPEQVSLWNEYVDRYHYLGYTPLAGAQMRYFIHSGTDIVALSGFSASAWRVAPRDWYIGWSEETRKQNLHLVVNNSRFLILPWVTSKNLASKILGLLARRIQADWQTRYNYSPLLLETFVEKHRFAGTCYKAANWKWVGTTQGRGKKDRFREFKLPPKEIFLYPLVNDLKTRLAGSA